MWALCFPSEKKNPLETHVLDGNVYVGSGNSCPVALNSIIGLLRKAKVIKWSEV